MGAIFVGAALAVSGAIMQGMTRNPLADPGLLGLTAGANAGLAITLAFIPNANNLGIMIACFIGSAVGATMVFGIGAMKKEDFHLCGSYWLVLQSLHSYLPFRKGSAYISRYQRCIDVDSWREYRNFMGAASCNRSVHFNGHPHLPYLFQTAHHT